MTRKEIETMCKKEMRHPLPDKDALWSRIETHVSEMPKKATEAPAPEQRFFTVTRVLPIAVAFALVMGVGTLLWSRRSGMFQNEVADGPSSEYVATQEAAGAAPEAALPYEDRDGAEVPSIEEENGAIPPMGDAAVQAPREDGNEAVPPMEDGNAAIPSMGDENEAVPPMGGEVSDAAPVLYSRLDVGDGEEISLRTPLETKGETDFSEEDVLEKTSCFAKVYVQSGYQEMESGEIVYTMELLDVYGNGEFNSDKFTMQSGLPYLLSPGHEYLLPLLKTDTGWRLAEESTPQIELTRDGMVIFHSGWHSLWTETCVPVVYDRVGEEDAFYHQMYLTDALALEDFLQEWAS